MGKGQLALDIRKCWQIAPETFGRGVWRADAPAKASVSSIEREPRLSVEPGGIWGTGGGGSGRTAVARVERERVWGPLEGLLTCI